MTVTVLPIIESEAIPAAPLAKVMNERLRRFAVELRDIHLKELETIEPMFEDLVIYIGYNTKYSIRWKIVNDVPAKIEAIVANQCALLGYIRWKTSTLNSFHGR
jgi:hypothetical protein